MEVSTIMYTIVAYYNRFLRVQLQHRPIWCNIMLIGTYIAGDNYND